MSSITKNPIHSSNPKYAEEEEAPEDPQQPDYTPQQDCDSCICCMYLCWCFPGILSCLFN